MTDPAAVPEAMTPARSRSPTMRRQASASFTGTPTSSAGAPSQTPSRRLPRPRRTPGRARRSPPLRRGEHPSTARWIGWRSSWSRGRPRGPSRGWGCWHAGSTGTRASGSAELRPDVVHIHGEFNPDNWWVPRLFSCPFVLSPQGGFNPMVLVKGRRLFKQAYIVAAKSIFYRRVTAFHALSPLEEEHVLRLVPRASVYCVPQGPGPIHPDAIDATIGSRAHRRRRHHHGRARGCLHERARHPGRGIRARCRRGAAARVAHPRRPGLERRRAQLECSAQRPRRGRPRSLRRPGRRHAPSAELLATSDVYVQASRHEGFSLAVAEALVAGKPVIMTRENGAAAYDGDRLLSTRPRHRAAGRRARNGTCRVLPRHRRDPGIGRRRPAGNGRVPVVGPHRASASHGYAALVRQAR